MSDTYARLLFAPGHVTRLIRVLFEHLCRLLDRGRKKVASDVGFSTRLPQQTDWSPSHPRSLFRHLCGSPLLHPTGHTCDSSSSDVSQDPLWFPVPRSPFPVSDSRLLSASPGPFQNKGTERSRTGSILHLGVRPPLLNPIFYPVTPVFPLLLKGGIVLFSPSKILTKHKFPSHFCLYLSKDSYLKICSLTASSVYESSDV